MTTLIATLCVSTVLAGASSWQNFVKYEPDVRVAFEKLQKTVFASGNYYQVRGGPKPKSIAELHQKNGEDGTHSVLDMIGVRTEVPPAEPEVGLVYRIPDQRLMQLFKTTMPSHAQVEAARHNVAEERGIGLYVVVYDNGKPSELFFTGISGD